ncbi:MAG: formyltetrahydrofolate deformylase [Myxococcaceae bacterium]
MPEPTRSDRARMLVSCPDRVGLVAAISQFLYERGANIVEFDQHTTGSESDMFFMRLEFELPELSDRLRGLVDEFAPIASRLSMDWRITPADRKQRVAIFVSRQDHCLLELLWQWRSGDLRADLFAVISNHEDLRKEVEAYGVRFHHVPVTPQAKVEAERAEFELVGSADLIVLARYMQILSSDFCARFPNRVINIHHSFLPAFVGANPYAQAFQRGVKLIGATAHYVTTELDAGPIIEQDVQRVGHRDDLEDLKRLGSHIERVVCARAVKWHLEDRVLIHRNRTVVFR